MPDAPQLDAARWRRIADCFEQALDVADDDRVAFVYATLPDDHSSAREVLDMLGATSSQLAIEPRLLAPNDDIALTGQQLGPFVVGAMIGRGGMGEVYRAERAQGTFEQTVAIKVMRPGAYSREMVRRFDVERRILARLAHPGIVSILDGGTTVDQRPYLVMPFVDGIPVTQWANARRLGLDERLRIFLRVAEVVQYAHGQLVAHRDLKPSNILVSQDGHVSLLDFGIARLLEPNTGDAEGHTQSSPLRLLTPEHAAPEQLKGERSGVAADVYALGVLLYDLCCGVRPFVRGERTAAELEAEILTQPPAPPSAVALRTDAPWSRRLRGDLDHIVLMALRKEPARRYASVAQLSADIERFLDGLPVRATADSVGYRARRFVGRHRFGVALGAVTALALIIVAVQATVQSARSARERDTARRAEASMRGVMAILTSLFETANPTMYPGGDTVRVAELLDRAQAKVDSLSGDPLTQAPLQVALGEMHHARGRPDIAAQLLETAVASFEQQPESNPKMLAHATISLARAVSEYEGRSKALPLFERALERHTQAYGAGAPETEIARREWTTADTLDARRVREIERMVSDSALAAVTDTMARAERIHALGVQRFRDGDIIAATPLFEEALRLVDLKLPKDHPTRLLVLGTVASAKYEAGAFPEAEAMARARLAEQTTRVPVNNVGVAHSTEFLAAVEASRGFLMSAESHERSALALWRSALAPTHPSQWNALSNLATIVSLRGRHKEALALYDSASALARNGTPEDRVFIDQLRIDALLRANRVADADALLRATAVQASAFPPTQTIRSGHAWRRAVVAAAQGRADDARQALDEFQRALNATLPPIHPLHDGAACLRAALTPSLPTPAEDARTSCHRYARWGLAIGLVPRLALSAP